MFYEIVKDALQKLIQDHKGIMIRTKHPNNNEKNKQKNQTENTQKAPLIILL